MSAPVEEHPGTGLSFLKATLESVADGVYVVDRDGKILAFNERILDLWRIPRALLESGDNQVVIGAALANVKDPETLLKRIQEIRSQPEKESLDLVEHIDGRTFERFSRPLYLNGEPFGRVWSFRDVTEQLRTEEALREAEERYRTIVETAHDAIWTLDTEGRFTFVNRPGLALGGFVPENVIGKNFLSFMHPEDLPKAEEAFRKVLGGEPQSYTTRVRVGGERTICVVVSKVPLFKAGEVVGAAGFGHDITEQRRAEEALKASEERYRLLFERNLAGVFRNTVDGRILDCNDSFAKIFGFDSGEECRTQGAFSLYFDPAERERLVAKLQRTRVVTNEPLCLRQRDGQSVWLLANIALLDDEQGNPSIMEGTIIDVTDWKRAEEQIAFQAYHDSLTGLPNRTLLHDRLMQALAHARRTSGSLAVMSLDLDHFKAVNDTLGHSVGDLLLREVATRLKGCVREGDSVARVGSDEFNLLLQDVSRDGDLTRIAQKVRDCVARPFDVGGSRLYVTTSIGASLFPNDGEDANSLLESADNALFRAKELGQNAFQLASHAMSQRVRDRLALGNALHRALENEEFVVHFQPQVELEFGEVVGVEALVRWESPERGLVFPGDFIAVAEETRLIVPIGEWVLRAACRQARDWQVAGLPSLRVAVNLSPHQFQDESLLDVIVRALESTGLSPRSLELEITESAAMQNPEHSGKVLGALREMGIGISIDDFGTGYSSLSYLTRFPISAVKIDQSFVRGVETDEGDTAIVAAVLALAQSLRLRTVAEGVENAAQLSYLKGRGCKEAQGYLLGRPVPAGELFR